MTTTRPRAGRVRARRERQETAGTGPGLSPVPGASATLAVHALYALSGATALVYEVTWARLLSLELGHTIAAASTVLAAFMGGLTAGALAGGRVSSRISARSALRAYASIEFAIAVFALLLPFLVRLAHPVLSLAYSDGSGAPLFQFARTISCIAIVGLPALAMGASYPLIVGATGTSARAASLYAANTAGAALGATLAGFVLLGALGIFRTTLAAAMGNLLVASVAFRLAPAGERSLRASQSQRLERTKHVANRVALVAAAVSGFAALLLELAWARTLALIVGPTTYAFSTMVACFISGLALGSAAGTAIARRAGYPGRWLAACFGLAGISIALSVLFVDEALLAVGRRAADPQTGLAPLLLVGIRWAAVLTIPTAICFGALFPLALAVSGLPSPRVAAQVYGANTLGAIAGALAGGLLILPAVGVRGAFLTAVGISVLAGVIAALLEARRAPRWAAATFLLCAVAAALPVVEPWNRELLSSGAYKYSAYLGSGHLRDLLQAGNVLYYREGATGTIAVRDLTGVRTLSIDGKVDASNGRDMLTQRLLAHLPLLAHPRPDRVAIVGLGSGVTAGSALTHSVRGLDVIEISPEVVEASAWFRQENRQALRDPRVRLILGDARTHFRLSDGARYDVVISEPSNPWMAGVAALFTREFFEEVRARLTPGGLACQWTHAYDISRKDLQSIVATFASVFPDVSLWLVGESDLLLMGSNTHRAANVRRVSLATATAHVAADLARNGLTSPRDLAAFYLGDRGFARAWSKDAELQVDDRMALEFSAPRATVGATSNDNASELAALASAEAVEEEVGVRRAGLVLAASNAPRRAWPYLTRAVGQFVDDRDVVAAYVQTAATLDRLADAERVLARMIEQHATAMAPRLEYARLLASRGDPSAARIQLLAAARQAPERSAAWEELAAIAADAENVGDLQAAVERLRLLPESTRAHYYEGVLHLLAGRPRQASESARLATTADPENAAAWNLLGASLGADNSSPDEIRLCFERAIDADPADPAPYVNLGTLELKLARLDAAADWFAQALTLDPASLAARDGLVAVQRAREQQRHPKI